MSILVTGGAGFIGSNFILSWIDRLDEKIINVDALTYAGNLMNLESIKNNRNYVFIRENICNSAELTKIVMKFKPRAIINFAAESHVDRSIKFPENFINTNIIGTFHLLEVSRKYFTELSGEDKKNFRFFHISTDEVYGSLTTDKLGFTEEDRFQPNSPYSASKAASDHLVRSYYQTYGLSTLTANCSNNYGPYQFPEKFIPLCINNAITEKEIPIYGDGRQIRDWLYVDDFCSAISKILISGRIGETYNVGGDCEKTNLNVAYDICSILDDIKPRKQKKTYRELISFTKDRPGHDRRYSINANKIKKELGWEPTKSFESGLTETVKWYLDNNEWVDEIINGNYINWYKNQYE